MKRKKYKYNYSFSQKVQNFLMGFPYGLYGRVISVEDLGIGKYSLWDRIRYRLLTGKSLIDKEEKK